MFFITHRNIFFAITGTVLALAIGSVAVFGLNLGIDFTGGVLTNVVYEDERPGTQQLQEAFVNAGMSDISIRPSGDDGYIVRTASISDEQREALPELIGIQGAFTGSVERLTEVGPTIGSELRSRALLAIALVIGAIVLYIAFTFRRVSRPVSSWTYGGIAIAALAHDILVPVGVFAAMGAFLGTQIDALFVMALLAILGYSVNDTIVVFDRVRENLRALEDTGRTEPFSRTVGKSLSQTIVRSINTSLTTLFVLAALFFFGPPAITDFTLAMLVGVIAGAYSSVAFAAPLLVAVEGRRRT